ncbi:universal stress protein [Thioalkalivibrio sp. XN279]|uniref:universal stress protein n=1 Tax=Thioalkalivibrio sp. XN279 TaxID=2714953 RepID=UPI00140DCAE5|nr:universal stress protein [Thioalkalivibrio sp. XN279]NHA14949.1 universal stress protein [Thioalkalivibrio sp. XN279]
MNLSGPSPVLVVMDPADVPDHALARGARLAGALRLPLELFRVEFDQAMEGSHFRVTERLEAARAARVDASLAWLQEKAQPWRQRGFEVAVAAEYANPGHEAVTRRALAVGAALVVMRTHHHEWLARATLSAADWQLIRICPAPLLLAKGRDWPQHPRLLAAVDPSHRDDRHARLDHAILDLAERLGSALQAQSHVAHCVAGGAAREATAAVNALLADRSIPAPQLHLIEGRPEQELPRLAAEFEADVLLAGGISRSRVEQVFVGGTAERLLDRAECDLLVVKPPGFRSPLA